MSRRRRAGMLLGLALVLGGLAAADVSRRESALARRLGPAVPVVVARQMLPAGSRIAADRLALRRIPARYAPAGAVSSLGAAVGLRSSAAVPAGGYLSESDLASANGPSKALPLGRGERVVDVVAAGSSELITPGTRVDVLVTREPYRGAPGQTTLALEDVDVLAASAAGGGDATGAAAGTPRVRASLRVGLRQAVYLAAAQGFARELRLLPRAADDHRRGSAGVAVDASLG
jgi:pilus assembly protein CpaB